MKILGLSAVITLLFSQVSYAYLDTSVMTYAIQGVAAVVIAVGAGAGMYFQKAKSKVSKTLHIDENQKKEQEADVVLFDETKEN